MAQHGRKSAASLVKLATSRKHLTPVLPLSVKEQAHFDTLVRDNVHLVESDAQLLTQYVVCLTKAAEQARSDDINDWDKAVRLALQIGTKLKILPSTTIDPVALGRRKADHTPGLRKPWDGYETRDMPSDLPPSKDDCDDDPAADGGG
jgi:hypothetical protein